MVKIAHISDLHFGRTNEEALAALTSTLDEERPDLTVITGDLTQSGRRREYRQVAAFLKALNGRFLAVPGNHDAPVYNLALRFWKPWARYEKHVGAAAIQCVTIGPLSIIGVNSARRAQPRINWSHGRLPKSIVEASSAIARQENDAGRQVILALHHPVAPGPGKAGARIVGNGEYALQQFAENGVSAILTGHVHVAAAAPLVSTGGRILSIQAGTAVSTRERGEQASFGMMNVSRDKIMLTVRRFSQTVFKAEPAQAFLNAGGVWRRHA